MKQPMHGGILLIFYYWLQNTAHLTEGERNEFLEWSKTEQWDKLPCLVQLLHIYHAWETEKTSSR